MVTFATQLLQLIKILTMHTSFTTPAQVWNRLALCYILTFSLLHLSFLKELILAMINSIYQSQLVTFPVQATLWYIKGYISSLHINLYVMVKLDNFLHVKKKTFLRLTLTHRYLQLNLGNFGGLHTCHISIDHKNISILFIVFLFFSSHHQ